MAEYYIPVAQYIDSNTLARYIDKPAFHYHLQCFLEYQLKSELDSSSPFIYILDKICVTQGYRKGQMGLLDWGSHTGGAARLQRGTGAGLKIGGFHATLID